jgi:hypothetical protein
MDMRILAVVIGGWIGISVMVTLLVVAVSRAGARATPKVAGGSGYYLVPASAMVPAGGSVPARFAAATPRAGDRYSRTSPALRSSSAARSSTGERPSQPHSRPCTIGAGTYRGTTMAGVKSGRARLSNGHPSKLPQR